MKCLEFRRQIRSEPHADSAEMVAHAQSCASCAKVADRSARFERSLKAAVAFEMPSDLEARLVNNAMNSGPRAAKLFHPSAIAACVALFGVVLTVLWWGLSGAGPVGPELVKLINGAPYSFVSTEAVSSFDLRKALEPVGITIDGELENVTFASRCYVRDQMAGHVVVRGETAPITIFLIPVRSEYDLEQFRDGSFSGLVLPGALGTVAVVGAPGEPLKALADKLHRLVRWPA